MDKYQASAPQQLGQSEVSAIEALRQLHLNASRQNFPSVPEHARTAPSYSDKTANSLTKCIISFINLTGGQAERISNTGRYVDNRKKYTDVLGNTRTIGSVQWIKGTGENGTADISAIINGRSVKIEVKVGRDRQSTEQKQYQQRIEKAGGIYVIAKDFQSFYLWYQMKFQSNEQRQ
jgi:hypothetical protein